MELLVLFSELLLLTILILVQKFDVFLDYLRALILHLIPIKQIDSGVPKLMRLVVMVQKLDEFDFWGRKLSVVHQLIIVRVLKNRHEFAQKFFPKIVIILKQNMSMPKLATYILKLFEDIVFVLSFKLDFHLLIIFLYFV